MVLGGGSSFSYPCQPKQAWLGDGQEGAATVPGTLPGAPDSEGDGLPTPATSLALFHRLAEEQVCVASFTEEPLFSPG